MQPIQIICFPLNFCPLILASICECYSCCSEGDCYMCLISSFINFNFPVKKSCPFPIFIYSFDNLFISILTQISFYFWSYSKILSVCFVAHNFPALAIGSSSRLIPTFFLHASFFFLFSNSLLSGTLGSSRLILYFLPQIKNQTFLQGAIRPLLNVF